MSFSLDKSNYKKSITLITKNFNFDILCPKLKASETFKTLIVLLIYFSKPISTLLDEDIFTSF